MEKFQFVYDPTEGGAQNHPTSRSGVTHVEQRRTILLVLDTVVQLIESKINFMIQISSASSTDIPLIYISL